MRPSPIAIDSSGIMSLSVTDKLGPYEIVAPIGKGGMGEVYRARDTRLNREVAVKVSAERFTERFEREARTIAAAPQDDDGGGNDTANGTNYRKQPPVTRQYQHALDEKGKKKLRRQSVGESNAVFLWGYGQRSGSRRRENRDFGHPEEQFPGCTDLPTTQELAKSLTSAKQDHPV